MVSRLSGIEPACRENAVCVPLLSVSKKKIEYCVLSVLLDHENIFIVSLHEILLPGNFFHPLGIGFEQLHFLAGFANLFFVVFLAFFQIIQLSSVLHMQKDIVVVKEHHPYHKKYSGNQKFVLK
jgi:hypothetical protein